MRYDSGVGLWLLGAWIVVFAMWIVTHVVVLLQAMRVRRLGAWRFVALLQAPAPFVAWAGGARRWPLLWLALCAGYVALRLRAP